jgi:hypothetical protein
VLCAESRVNVLEGPPVFGTLPRGEGYDDDLELVVTAPGSRSGS